MTSVDTTSSGIETIRTPEIRSKNYGDLTSLLGMGSPDNFLDIFRFVDASHPTDETLEAKLRETQGRRFDFIGAGITGVTSAYVAGELSRRFGLNWEIHVWDRESMVGYGSTKDRAARTRTSMFGSAQEIQGNLATSLFFENLPHILSRKSRGSNPIDPGDVHTGLHRCGYLWLFDNGNSNRLKINQSLLAQFSLPAFILDPNQVAGLFLPEINTDRFTVGYYCPTDAHVEPTSILNALYGYTSKVLGVKYHFNHEIEGVNIGSGKNIRFRTKYGGNKHGQNMGEQHTYYLAVTAGARSKRLGEYFKVGDAGLPLEVQLTPRFRQLTYVTGLTEEELEAANTFNIFMGKGAYWSRESRGAHNLIFGFARPDDPEVPSQEVHKNRAGSEEYFIERILLEGRLAELCRRFDPEVSDIQLIRHPGNLYGETADGNYLVGLSRQANDARPDGVVGINAGDNGHGIMASLGTSVHLVYRLTGVKPNELQIWDPNRKMNSGESTVRL